MKIIRYYSKEPIELAQVRGIRGVLLTELKWEIIENVFHLYYPGEELIIDDTESLQPTVRDRGKPGCVYASFKSAASDTLEIKTCAPEEVIIEVDGQNRPPDEVFNQIEPMLGLTRITEVQTRAVIRSAFIAHAFDDEGRQYAGEVSHFLDLLEISNESGRTFSPEGVAEK